MVKKIEYKRKIYSVDEHGFLKNPKDWDKDWAECIKRKEGIEVLTEEHWKVIKILRSSYTNTKEKEGVSFFATRIIIEKTGYSFLKISKLFPQNSTKGACRIAGLPYFKNPNIFSH